MITISPLTKKLKFLKEKQHILDYNHNPLNNYDEVELSPACFEDETRTNIMTCEESKAEFYGIYLKKDGIADWLFDTDNKGIAEYFKALLEGKFI